MAGVAVAEMISISVPKAWGSNGRTMCSIRGRKVCGILTEMKTTGAALDAVVVGIGLNVNIAGRILIRRIVIRRRRCGRRREGAIRREDVAFLLCDHLEKWYQIFLREGFTPVRERWLALSEMTGRRVRVLFQGEVQEGVVVGIDFDGALLLDDERGAVRRIIAGDASIMKG